MSDDDLAINFSIHRLRRVKQLLKQYGTTTYTRTCLAENLPVL